MSVGLIEAARRSRANANELRSGFVKATPNEERDVRVMAATMDHSSIRALIGAFPHFFAGLPRSDCGDRPGGRASSSASRRSVLIALPAAERTTCAGEITSQRQPWVFRYRAQPYPQGPAS